MNYLRRLGVLLVIALALVSCTRPINHKPSPPAATAVQILPATQDLITSAVFHFQLNSNFNDNFSPKTCSVIFLSVNDKDPSDALMSLMKNSPVPLKAVSQCTYSVWGVKDIKTGAYGGLLRIDSIKFLRADFAEVRGGYFASGKSSSWNRYHLLKTKGGWKVTQDIMTGIS